MRTPFCVLALLAQLLCADGCAEDRMHETGTSQAAPAAASSRGASGLPRATASGLGIADPVLRAAFIAARQAEADRSYHLRAAEGVHRYRAISRAARVRTTFADARVAIRPAAEERLDEVPPTGDVAYEVRLSLARMGYGSALEAVPVAESPSVEQQRISYRRGEVVEWYLNGPLGLEQGFTLAAPPTRPPTARNAELVLEIAVEGAEPRLNTAKDTVMLDRGDGCAGLRYGELTVLDAERKAVPARLAAVGSRIQIRIDDSRASYPLEIDPLVAVSELWLRPRVYGTDSTQMGRAVDVDGDVAVVGAPGYQVGGEYVGAAYVFHRAGQRWAQEGVLIGPVAGGFATGVAIRGDTIAVGAPTEDAGDGAVYVFTKVGLDWVEQLRLVAPEPEPLATPRFGGGLDLADGQLIVSSPGEVAAYLFEGAGSSWSYEGKFASTGPADTYAPVAVDGDVVVVRRNVYQRNAGQWSPAQTLADAVGAEPESASVDGDTLALGMIAPLDEVHVFAKQGSRWMPDGVLQPPGLGTNSDVGSALDVEGDLIAVGAQRSDLAAFDSGGAWVFARADGRWAQIAELGAPDGAMHDQLGNTIALSGGTLFVGSWGSYSPTGVDNHGAAYVSERQGTGFSPLVRVTPALDDSDPDDGLGAAVDIDGDTALVGAPGSDRQHISGGAGYVFVRQPGSVWEEQAILLAPRLRRIRIGEWASAWTWTGTSRFSGPPKSVTSRFGPVRPMSLGAAGPRGAKRRA